MAGELALAMVLLTGAGLMLKSFVRMNTHPPGFTPEKMGSTAQAVAYLASSPAARAAHL